MTKSKTNVNSAPETFKFDAEIGKVLKLVINSIYTHKEIFLRELISNASDACDKLRYMANTDASLIEDGHEFKIKIKIEKEARKLIISDSGIGMNKDEMIENLGTIARSGTENFLKMVEKSAPDLIGQFGVGFYSAFMVAREVDVISKKAGQNDAFEWKSLGDGEFTIEKYQSDVASGTTITLLIKDGEEYDEYLDKFRIEHIIKTYSGHVSKPIELEHEKDLVKIVNDSEALWVKNPSQCTAKDYKHAYSAISGLPGEPFLTIHSRVEGGLEYSCLLFIPDMRPFDLYSPERKTSIKLYVRRIFITDNNTDILPENMRFIKGVVDSSDLPLNISRETLQNNSVMQKIGKSLYKKILSDLKTKMDDKEKYQKFWSIFGNVMKEGLCKGTNENEKLLEVCIFNSNKRTGITLDEYISECKSDTVYYLTSDSLDDGRNSPQIESFTQNGTEVLILSDTVDNFWVNVINDYKCKNFKPVASADFQPEKKDDVLDDKNDEILITKFKEILGDEIKDVKVSKKLVESPVCLSQTEGGMSIRMERYLYEQKQLPYFSPKILEINTCHHILQKLAVKITDGIDVSEAVHTLFDTACLEAGDIIRKPSDFVKRIWGGIV